MLLSVYAQQLKEKKVIAIRIDLNKFYYKEAEFTDSFLLKSIQILREKYFDEKEIDFGGDDMRGYIARRWGITDSKGNISLSDLNNMFQRFFSLRLYDIASQLDTSFIDAVIDYLSEKLGYAFVFIIDGLDRVTLSEVNESLFKRGCESVLKIITFKYFKEAVYVISMRNTSYLDAVTSYEDHEVWRYPKRLIMLPVTARAIWEARMRYAECSILSLAQKDSNLAWLNKDNIATITRGVNLIICNSVLGLRKYKLSEEEYQDLKNQGLNFLERISAGNHRALMKCLRAMFLQIFGIYDRSIEDLLNEANFQNFSSLSGKEYQVRRILYHEREESNNYRVPYTYQVESNKVRFITNHVFDSIVPNVFNFIDKRFTKNLLPPTYQPVALTQEYRILLKLRILQILKKGNMKRFALIDMISSFLGYSRFFLKYELEEMIHFQLVKPLHNIDVMDDDDYPVEITGLGEEVLSRFIFDFPYFEIIVDDTPIPFQLIERFTPMNKYWARISLDQYVAVKLRSVLNFLKILTYIEEKEEIEFNSVHGGKESFVDKGFAIARRITVQLEKEIIAMLRERIEFSPGFLSILAETFGLPSDVFTSEESL